jgi:hypothetical protein
VKRANLRIRVICLALLPAVLFLFMCRPAASHEDSFLNRLQGTWQGEGQAYGRPNHLLMKWEWVLGKKFLRLSLKNEMTTTNGQKQLFEGQAFYQPVGEGKHEARWFDSRGVSMSIKAHAEGNALIALWSAPGLEQGRSTYKIVEPGKLEVIDEVQLKDGSWKEFGRVMVTRE